VIMMPQWFFHEAGIDVRRDLVNQYVGSQESSIMNVYLGKTVAGATWPPPWRSFVREHPDIAAQLEVKWETPSLVNNGLVVRADVPPETVRRVRELLLRLPESEEGRALLASLELSRFEAADEASFQPVKDFLERFERQIRPAKEQ
ncbi:MAG: phosphate/phosphite/phosphonate ABC transporter substrate-binding protein, partial [Actinomycetota bacterium]